MDWNTNATTHLWNYAFDTQLDTNTSFTQNFTLTSPDPLIDWLPNSCLYTKYVPTWHLMESYGPHDDLTNQEILDVLEARGYFK